MGVAHGDTVSVWINTIVVAMVQVGRFCVWALHLCLVFNRAAHDEPTSESAPTLAILDTVREVKNKQLLEATSSQHVVCEEACGKGAAIMRIVMGGSNQDQPEEVKMFFSKDQCGITFVCLSDGILTTTESIRERAANGETLAQKVVDEYSPRRQTT